MLIYTLSSNLYSIFSFLPFPIGLQPPRHRFIDFFSEYVFKQRNFICPIMRQEDIC